MAGQTYTESLKPGDRCIVVVDDVNSPTGWWWGIVGTFEWKDDHRGGWGSVTATITGKFGFGSRSFSETPEYGTSSMQPTVNYRVYPADRETVGLVRQMLAKSEANEERIQSLSTRLDELRSLIKSMGVKPEMIRDAVAEALRAVK